MKTVKKYKLTKLFGKKIPLPFFMLICLKLRTKKTKRNSFLYKNWSLYKSISAYLVTTIGV